VRSGVFVALFLVGVLVAAPLAGAWHWEDERETTQYMATSGDPRILEEDAGCIEAVRDVAGADCAVLYAHVYSSLVFF
jgi:hypothetical protein